MTAPVRQLEIDLANQLQAATGFICLEDYSRAQQAIRNAANTLELLRPWFKILERTTKIV